MADKAELNVADFDGLQEAIDALPDEGGIIHLPKGYMEHCKAGLDNHGKPIHFIGEDGDD